MGVGIPSQGLHNFPNFRICLVGHMWIPTTDFLRSSKKFIAVESCWMEHMSNWKRPLKQNWVVQKNS